MASADELSRPERLAIDVDTRLSEVWRIAWDPETLIGALMRDSADLAESVGKLMRAAYGTGYCDALREDRQGRRAELALDNGYRPL